jgi:glycosyltransferase involved in cell wall biosynthesis
LAPLEAHACGKPVIAFGRGGALETLIPANPAPGSVGASCNPAQVVAPTAVFFYEQTPAAVVVAVRQFERMNFSPEAARAQAMRFDTSRFRRELLTYLDLAARYAPLPAHASAVAD